MDHYQAKITFEGKNLIFELPSIQASENQNSAINLDDFAMLAVEKWLKNYPELSKNYDKIHVRYAQSEKILLQ